MLVTDSVTVAVEVVVILSPNDLVHLRDQAGFDIPIEMIGPLNGHIDVLQIRYGATIFSTKNLARTVRRSLPKTNDLRA